MKRLLCIFATLAVSFAYASSLYASSKIIKYLHVEANEGDSAAGHTAIRFDKDTFHFQHEPSGLIRIKRFDSANFDYLYTKLGNRSVNESWITVTDDTYRLLFDGFSQFQLIQDEQFNFLDTLRRDIFLFEFLLHRKMSPENSNAYPLKGVGYLLPDQHPNAPSTLNLLPKNINLPDPFSNLRRRILDKYGKDYLDVRISTTLEDIHKIRLRSFRKGDYKVFRNAYPAYMDSPSTLFDESVSALFALEFIRAPYQELPDSYWIADGSRFRFSLDERLLLRSYAQKTEDALLDLVNSSRSDWGYAFIVGLARLASINASVSSGTFVFPDIFADSPSLNPINMSLPFLSAYRDEVEELFQKRRQEFFSSTEMRESDFAALEYLGNNYLELNRSIKAGVVPRPLPENPVPSRAAMLTDLVLPEFDRAELEKELEAARLAKKEYEQLLSETYSYDLFRRNCVTEIFASINSLFQKEFLSNGVDEKATNISEVKNISIERLGGYVDPRSNLNFIPFISSGEVDACYNVTQKRIQPSYRSARLAEMKTKESPLVVFLRESNTLTSTIYSRASNDSPFIFFTDDTIIFRPVFGVFNLLAGVGESLAGIITMPVEGPKRFYLGAKGVMFSLPELVFINVRKGAMEYVPETR